MKQKQLFIMLMIVLAGVVAGLALSKQKERPQQRVVVELSPLPSSPQEVVDSKQPDYLVSRIDPVPDFVSHVVPSVNWQPDEQAIASYFKITASASAIVGSRGKFFVQRDDEKSLILGGSPFEIGYTRLPTLPSAEQGEFPDYSAAALNALINIPGTPSSVLYKLSSSSYYQTIGGSDDILQTNKTTARFVKYSFDFSVNNLPLFASSPTRTQATVFVDRVGNVVSLQTYLFPPLTTTDIKIPLFSADELVQKLKTNLGVVMHYEEKEEDVSFLRTDVAPVSSSIYKTTLGYYFLSSQKALLPVMIFTGEGKDLKTNLVITTTTLVGAARE